MTSLERFLQTLTFLAAGLRQSHSWLEQNVPMQLKRGLDDYREELGFEESTLLGAVDRVFDELLRGLASVVAPGFTLEPQLPGLSTLLDGFFRHASDSVVFKVIDALVIYTDHYLSNTAQVALGGVRCGGRNVIDRYHNNSLSDIRVKLQSYDISDYWADCRTTLVTSSLA